jgi:hypothetical protein
VSGVRARTPARHALVILYVATVKIRELSYFDVRAPTDIFVV